MYSTVDALAAFVAVTPVLATQTQPAEVRPVVSIKVSKLFELVALLQRDIEEEAAADDAVVSQDNDIRYQGQGNFCSVRVTFVSAACPRPPPLPPVMQSPFPRRSSEAL